MKFLSFMGLSLSIKGSALALSVPWEASLPRDPERTGILGAEHKQRLWSLFEAIGKVWQSGEYCTLDQDGLSEIIDLKTSRPPSYLSEYEAASQQLAQAGTSLEGLLLKQQRDPGLKRHVIAEFIELQLAFGGFKALGYQNYKGFMGGPFHAPRPPYRVYK